VLKVTKPTAAPPSKPSEHILLIAIVQVTEDTLSTSQHCTLGCCCRSKAVECLGLYALVAAPHNPSLLTGAVSLLGPLLAAEGSDTVRAAAVRALVDISLLYGPAAVDAVLRRPAGATVGAAGTGAGAAAEGDDGAGEQAAEGLSCSSGSSVAGAVKGLLELLLEQAEVLLAEAQAAAGGVGSKARGKRGGR